MEEEDVEKIVYAIRRIAGAITPADAMPMRTPDGLQVGSLTEAVIFAAENMGRVADAISDLAEAVRERG